MAVAQGYGKTVTSGSVFAYDVGDTRNSYIGKPTTNLLTTLNKSNVDTSLFKIAPGQEVKNVPGIGNTTVHYVDVYNDYNGGSGNCCPAPMQFGDFTVTPSTEYTYQIIYKTSTGYAHPNYMYHYEYNGGTYVTEYGLWNGSRQTDLGDGWKHAWGTFTSNASTNRFICYLFHYEYGTQNRIEVAGVMLTQGNAILPPNQFIPVNTTRSATQGLLPLVGNSGIDLSNVSFDSNAQMVFDGTNDYIQTNLTGTYSQITYEFIGFFDDPALSTTSRNESAFGDWISSRIHFGTRWSVGMHWNVNGVWNQIPNTNLKYGWNHYALVWDHVNNKKLVYLNGILSDSRTTNGNITMGDFKIGVATNLNAYYRGNINIFKTYNRALTAAEVNQNYRHYKTRFNLS